MLPVVLMISRMTRLKTTDSIRRDREELGAKIFLEIKKTIKRKAAICKSYFARLVLGTIKDKAIVIIRINEWVISCGIDGLCYNLITIIIIIINQWNKRFFAARVLPAASSKS